MKGMGDASKKAVRYTTEQSMREEYGQFNLRGSLHGGKFVFRATRAVSATNYVCSIFMWKG